MSKRFEIGSVYVCQESSFGVEPDADGSDYKHIRAFEASFVPTVQVIERDGLLNTLARMPHVVGQKTGTISLKTDLKGSGTPAESTAAEAESHEMLEAVFGAPTVGVGSTVVGSSSTDTAVDVASDAGFEAGMLAIFDCGAPYGFVPRFIASKGSDTLTLERALPAVPATSSKVHATTMYTRKDSGQKSLAFACVRDGVLVTFLGCKLDSLAIETVEAGAIAKLVWTFSCSSWHTAAKASLPAPTLAGNTLTPPPVIKGGACFMSGSEKAIYSLAVDFGLNTVFQDSTCAQGPANPDTVNAGMVVVQSRPVGTVKTYYDATNLTAYAAGTEAPMSFHCGAGLGNAWGLKLFKTQQTALSAESRNGIYGESVNFAVNDNGSAAEYALCLA